MITTKINSGELGGRILQLPPQSITRAVSSKVRATIFNKLEVRGRIILDLYAGGGTLGFEALSHGAEEVTFVDMSDSAIKVLKQNAKALNFDKQIRIKKMDVKKYVKDLGLKYDIIFLDPPYKDFNNALVKSASYLLQLGGILVISCSSKSFIEEPNDTIELDEKNYGDTKIVYLQKQ
jgi:16S rRNA (guanine966-N2)-methyltransferase